MNRRSDRVLWMDEGAKAKFPSRKSNLLFFSLVLLGLILGSLFYVWSRIQVIQRGYQISSAMKTGRRFAEENKKLRLEIATLKSYARIERLATEELGMFKPRTDQVIIIR